MNAKRMGKKKKVIVTSRNIKVFCKCGFKFNTSRKQVRTVLEDNTAVSCPSCGKAMKWEGEIWV